MTSSRQSFDLSANGKNNQSPISTANSNAALTGAARAFIQAQPTREPTENAQNTISNISPRGAPPNPIRLLQNPRSRRESWEAQQSQKKKPQISSPRNDSLQPVSSGSLAVPKTRSRVQSHSPSNIAASLAAARASPTAMSLSPPERRQLPTGSYATGSAVSTAAKSVHTRPKIESVSLVAGSPEQLDLISIPSTNSLVKLFEGKNTDHEKMPIRSPKPIHRSPVLDDPSSFPVFPTNVESLENRRENFHVVQSIEKDDDASSMDSFMSARELRSPQVSPVKMIRPPVPMHRRSAKDISPNRRPVDGTIEPIIRIRPPTRNTSRPIDIKRPSPSPVPSPNNDPVRQQSITALYHQLHPRRVTPLTTGDSLANAIVASSLASSRAPSPTKLPPVPAMRRKSSSMSHASHTIFSRTPSPPKKGMRQTMRKTDSASSDDDEDPYGKHKKKRFVRKHPNKHHEGDRKRWRDAVTLRERKRYEGVWAANKGLHVLYTPLEQERIDTQPHAKSVLRMKEAIGEQVSNIVTRDIWSRSRLPAHILEQVWDLVDTEENGRLLKEEFVVGLWLIDQLLKGRKLPFKVSETVWNSVKFLQGIALPKKT